MPWALHARGATSNRAKKTYAFVDDPFVLAATVC
jgi:hypothetical protein